MKIPKRLEKLHKKIAIIIGTRAELIKIFPLILEIEKNKIPYHFIHTGQHSLGDLCSKLKIKNPDVILSKEPKKSSKFNSNQFKAILWNLGLIFKIKRELKKLDNLEYVLYHGDTMTTASASIASSKLLNPFKDYKNVHLEAGLRSYNNHEPFPEEISRKIAGKFSDILFAVSDKSEENLKNKRKITKDYKKKRDEDGISLNKKDEKNIDLKKKNEGEINSKKKEIISDKKKKIIKVGNTIIDSVDIALDIAKKEKVKPLSKEKFALITVHRHENLKSKERMEKIVEILSSLKIKSFFAMHDNTKHKLLEYGLYEKLEKNDNIKIIPPMNYHEFIYQMSKCSLIVCDGGSMQEESIIFKKPCIILRKCTERQEGIEMTNFQFLSKLDVQETKDKINEFLLPNFKIKPFKNPYGERGVSKKILEVLEHSENLK